MNKIIVHNKSAHLDDYLACCILAAKTDLPIYRTDWPTKEQLEDPETFVVDFGREHNPALKNFDHHQITGGEQCAFTLILEYYGLRDYEAIPFIRFVENFDHNGPRAAMDLVGGGDFTFLISPIQEVILDQFSRCDLVIPSLRDFMSVVGRKIISLVEDYKLAKEDIFSNAVTEIVNGVKVADYRKVNKDYSTSLAALNFERENDIGIVLNNNERSGGEFRMIRKKDWIDFNMVKDKPGVGFVHQNGFLCCFEGDYKDLLNSMDFSHDPFIWTPIERI